MKNNKQLGEIGERVVIGELAKLKIDVLLPMTDNLPFDFAILFNNNILKCQIKATNTITENNSYRFSLTSNNWNKGTEYHYTKEDFDLLFCYNMILDEIYVFSYGEIKGKSNIFIRSEIPSNNQSKINKNTDYLLSLDRLNSF